MREYPHFELEIIPEVAEPDRPVVVRAKPGSDGSDVPRARLVDPETEEEVWSALLEPSPDGTFEATFLPSEPARYQLEVGVEGADAWDVAELIVASPGYSDVSDRLRQARAARRFARFYVDRHDRAAAALELQKAARLYEEAGKDDIAADVWIDLAQLQLSRRPDRAVQYLENATEAYARLDDQSSLSFARQLADAARLVRQCRFWQLGLDIQPDRDHCMILEGETGHGLILELGAGSSGFRTGSAIQFRSSEPFELFGDRLAIVKLDDIVDTAEALPEFLAGA